MNKLSAKHLVKIESVVKDVFENELHQKRQQSISYAVMGLLASETLLLHRMGEGLVDSLGRKKKHATKQIDRLLSNKGICVSDLSSSWVSYVIGNLKQITVAMDWSSFADDEQTMLSINIVCSKGLSTPLAWKSVDNSRLKYNRARYEDDLLTQLKSALPEGVEVTLLADRGFADHKFFRFLSEELKFKYVIRIKSNTLIFSEKEKLKAWQWLKDDGSIKCLKNAEMTMQKFPVKLFVAVKGRQMKGAWFLVSNVDITGRAAVNLYAKRWKIEPYFRDLKDGRFGCGLEQTHIKSSERRDRLMLVLALAYHLLIILGQAGESLGFDRMLKVNTVKTRTHSLFRQGQFYYRYFFRFTDEEQGLLMQSFERLLQTHDFWVDLLDEKI